MGRSETQSLPFEAGTYEGHGWWAARNGARGLFTAEYRIVARGDDEHMQFTRRVFLNDGGAAAYEEHSSLTFKPVGNGFIAISLNRAAENYVGHGYCYRNLCHCEVELDEGTRLEKTYVLSKGCMELIGSLTGKGNYTVWAESLRDVAR